MLVLYAFPKLSFADRDVILKISYEYAGECSLPKTQ